MKYLLNCSEDQEPIVSDNPAEIFASTLSYLMRREMEYSNLPESEWMAESMRRWPQIFNDKNLAMARALFGKTKKGDA